MNKLLSRILTAAVLTAAAVAFGVWLNRPPLAAAPAITTEAVPAHLAPPPIPRCARHHHRRAGRGGDCCCAAGCQASREAGGPEAPQNQLPALAPRLVSPPVGT